MPNLHSDKRYLFLSSLSLLFVCNVNSILSKQIQAGKSYHDSFNSQGILGNPALLKSDLVIGIHGFRLTYVLEQFNGWVDSA